MNIKALSFKNAMSAQTIVVIILAVIIIIFVTWYGTSQVNFWRNIFLN